MNAQQGCYQQRVNISLWNTAVVSTLSRELYTGSSVFHRTYRGQFDSIRRVENRESRSEIARDFRRRISRFLASYSARLFSGDPHLYTELFNAVFPSHRVVNTCT